MALLYLFLNVQFITSHAFLHLFNLFNVRFLPWTWNDKMWGGSLAAVLHPTLNSNPRVAAANATR